MAAAPVVRLERVVIGVDFTELSLAAAEWTVRHFARGAHHILTYAIDIPEPRVLAGRFPRRAEVVRRAREGAIGRMREIRQAWGDPTMRLDVRECTPVEAITVVAADTAADLIVVGEHTHSAAAGRTAESILEHATVPLLIARGDLFALPSRILAAVHDEHSKSAILAWSQFMSRHFGVRDADVTAVKGMSAGQLLAEQARGGYDMIVVGNRRTGGFVRALLGNVTTSMVRDAECPVLVVN